MWLQKRVQYLICIDDFNRKMENLPWSEKIYRCSTDRLIKAFDTINHQLLAAKVHAYGFDRDSLEIILSYLWNRYQRVKFNRMFSSWTELIQGVP